MYILSEGPGNYNNTPLVRTSNPMRRDVQNARPFGHLVIQIDTVNPGIWPFHCHIAWHASAGFFAQFVFQPNDIPNLEIPNSVYDTCNSWNTLSAQGHHTQIDSGM